MANESQNLKTFTPSVDEGLLDISPQLTFDAIRGINPFSKQSPFRRDAKESEIRDNLKSHHVSEFADFLLKGGARGFDRDDLDKTYAQTDNPLIKEQIMRGDSFVASGIIRNNFLGLDIDDRNLIAQAHIINARFNPISYVGKTQKGKAIPKEVTAEFNKLKKGKKAFDAGDITQSDYDIIKGKSYRNLTEDISKGASRSLFTDPRSREGMFINDPYGGRPESRKAAIKAGIGAFEQGFEGIRAYDVSPLEDLQLKSQYGFSPEVPSYFGPRTGNKYIPTKNQERFRVTPARETEGGVIPEKRIDRLESFFKDDESSLLHGPEGVYYNPEAQEFLRAEPTYGEPPTLQGYKYDPRLIELMRMQRSPAFAEQFKNSGGLTQLATGGKTMDIKQQTQNVANQGRYGDTMLMHVNPQEVRGLAQAMPLTVNPETGQPEAFLPFLAPLLGSWLGTTLLGAGTSAGLSGLAASSIGAGLGTAIESGSIKKGLISGLSAGALGAAMNAASGVANPDALTGLSDAATTGATNTALQNPNFVEALGGTGQLPGTVLNETGQQFVADAGTRALTRASPWDTAGSLFSGTEGFGGGIDALGGAMYSPTGMLGATAAGSLGVMNSQEAFARQMEQDILNREEEKRQNELMNPEPMLYSASGGQIAFNGGGPANIGADDVIYGNLPQIYAPARTPYDVNPDFMAGFSPETMYFNPATIAAPASSLIAGAAPTVQDTYTGSKGGYGGTQVSIAPQTSIDPYAAYTGSAPEGLIYTPEAIPEVPEVPVVTDPDVTDPDDGDIVDHPGDLDEDPLYPIDIGEEFNPTIPTVDMPNIVYEHEYPDKDIDISNIDFSHTPIPNIDIPNIDIPNIDFSNSGGFLGNGFLGNLGLSDSRTGASLNLLRNMGGTPYVSAISGHGSSPIGEQEAFASGQDVVYTNTEGPPQVFRGLPTQAEYGSTPSNLGPSIPNSDPFSNVSNILGPNSMSDEDIRALFGGNSSQGLVDNNSTDGSMLGATAAGLEEMGITPSASGSGGMFGPFGTSGISTMDSPPRQITTPIPNASPPVAPPVIPQLPPEVISQLPPEIQQLIPQLPPEVIAQVISQLPPEVTPPVSVRPPSVSASPRPRPLKTGGNTYVEGGQTAMMQDPLTQEVALYLLGQSNNEKALNMFLEKYGNEAFMQLRQMVLQSVAPNSQTEGLIAGVGNGGMDDDINGTIGNREQIAVSQDEFIVPADVVSMLGDGSSDAGSKELYDMMDRVRQEKTGTTRQAPKLANAGGLLPR